jgi:hypothetical protein
MCAICFAPAAMRVYRGQVRVSICDDCHFEAVELATSCELPKLFDAPRVMAPPDPVVMEIARELSAMVRA